MDNNVLKKLSYGMYAVSTLDGNRHVGCIANSIMQVTHDIIAVSINHENYTNICLNKTRKFAVSILGENIENNVIAFLGFQSGRDRDKFKNIGCIQKNGLCVVKSAVGYLICEIVDKVETETHTVFLARITDGEILNEEPPMSYSYYHKVRKGKSPKTAPTYQDDSEGHA